MESTFEEIVVDIAIYLFVASIFGYIGGVIGASKNRKRLGFILGLLFGPLGLFFTCMVWDKWKPSALTEMLEPLARDVVFTPDALRVVLADGREISAPLQWFPRLLQATPEQRTQWELTGDGLGIHWPSIEEDIEVESLLGLPPGRARSLA